MLINLKQLQKKLFMNNYSYTSDSKLLFDTLMSFSIRHMKCIELGFGDCELSESLHSSFDFFVSLDIQKANIHFSKSKNIKNIFLCDVKNPGIKQSSFDLCVFNPPFFRKGEGILSQDETRNINRHEIKAKLNDFINCACFAVKDRGLIVFVIPLSRLKEVKENLQLKIKYISVIGANSKKARVVIVSNKVKIL